MHISAKPTPVLQFLNSKSSQEFWFTGAGENWFNPINVHSMMTGLSKPNPGLKFHTVTAIPVLASISPDLGQINVQKKQNLCQSKNSSLTTYWSCLFQETLGYVQCPWVILWVILWVAVTIPAISEQERLWNVWKPCLEMLWRQVIVICSSPIYDCLQFTIVVTYTSCWPIV